MTNVAATVAVEVVLGGGTLTLVAAIVRDELRARREYRRAERVSALRRECKRAEARR